MTRTLRIALLATASAWLAAGCELDPTCREGEPGCAVDACKNQLLDGDETDVDCGGSCAPCIEGALCVANDDCTEGLCVGSACCAPPCVLATATLGGPERDQVIDALARDDGSIVVVGETRPEMDLGPGVLPYQGGTDLFMAAMRPDGTLAWARRMAGPNEDYLPHVIGHADGRIWVVASFQNTIDTGAGVLEAAPGGYGDLLLVELGADATPLRARSWEDQEYGRFVNRMIATPDGGALLLGTNESGDIFVVRLDRDTELMWHTRFGGRDESELAAGIALTPGGGVLVGFDYRGDPEIDETTVPALPGGGHYAFALTELDPDTGAMRWARSYGPRMFVVSLAVALDGSVFVSGNFGDDADIGLGRLQAAADSDAFVACFGSDGAPRWLVPFPAQVGSEGRAVLPTADGGVVAAVQIAGDLAFPSGVTVPTTVDGLVLARIDAAGQVLWAHDGGGIVVGTSIGLGHLPATSATSGVDEAFVFGGFAGTLTLGAPVTSRGKADAFVTRFAP